MFNEKVNKLHTGIFTGIYWYIYLIYWYGAVYRIFGCFSAEDTRFIRTVIDLPSVDLCIARKLHKFVHKYAVTYAWSSPFSF